MHGSMTTGVQVNVQTDWATVLFSLHASGSASVLVHVSLHASTAPTDLGWLQWGDAHV